MPYTYEYPRPAVTTDCIVFRKINSVWNILLIERAHDPFKACWALPGGFLEMDESLEECAARELQEETGLKNIALVQAHTFSTVNRDPRGRTISTVFYGFSENQDAIAGDDAKNLQWFPINQLPTLAFDHEEVINTILDKANL